MHPARFRSALAVAVGAHGAALVALALALREPRVVSSPPHLAPAELIVVTDVDEPMTSTPPASAEDARSEIDRATTVATRASAARVMHVMHVMPVTPGPGDAVATPDAVATAEQPPTAASDERATPWRPALTRNEAPGLDATCAYVAPPAMSAPASDGALASVRAEVNRRDRALGLSAGAPLLSITRDAVRRSRAPTTARARFEFRTDEAGVVASVHVVDASPSTDAWNEVASTLAREARVRQLVVPHGAHGIAITIAVSSSMRSASGTSRGATSVGIASPVATGVAKPSRAEQPLRFDVVIGPNQIDATMRMGPADALRGATSADERVVTAEITSERAL